MGQLRELYGERLDDPRTVLERLLALERRGPAVPGSPDGSAAASSAP
jgi:hypothetical protein